MHKVEDDGHAIKLARAIVVCKNIMTKFESARWAKIGGDVWLKIMHLVADSTQVPEGVERWMESSGFEEAWKVNESPRVKAEQTADNPIEIPRQAVVEQTCGGRTTD